MSPNELPEDGRNLSGLCVKGRVQSFHAFETRVRGRAILRLPRGALPKAIPLSFIQLSPQNEQFEKPRGADEAQVLLSLRIKHAIAVPKKLIVSAVFDLALKPKCCVGGSPWSWKSPDTIGLRLE